MLTIQGKGVRLCDRVARREFLRIGGLGSLGLSLPELCRARRAAAATKLAGETTNTKEVAPAGTFGRAKRCIVLFMWGGPPHLDTFDMKPDAPREIRGDFLPIPTNVPGLFVSDHLPLLSRQADKFTLIRSLTHTNGDHISQAHDMLTGNAYPRAGEIVTAARTDNPHYGAVRSHLKPVKNGLPAYVQVPCHLRSNSGKVIPGQNGGFLGLAHDPFLVEGVPNKGAIQDPNFTSFTPADVRLPDDVNPARVDLRRRLVRAIDRRSNQLDAHARQGIDSYYQQAFSLLSSPATRAAFDLSAERPETRDWYGRHTFGQGVLLARRLIEAGVPLVTVYWPNGPPRTDIGWDNHINNFPNLKNWQLPPLDDALSALLEDLARSGLLDETLVVCVGEFGRSPNISDVGGRDHWPYVFTALLAGAGLPRGSVYGSSDERGAYPKTQPVTPIDLGATIFHLLGIESHTVLRDQFTGQPHPVCRGTPIAGLI